VCRLVLFIKLDDDDYYYSFSALTLFVEREVHTASKQPVPLITKAHLFIYLAEVATGATLEK